MLNAFPWGAVVIGGPILLLVVLFWARQRTRSYEKKIDPDTPSDDPSQGMTGHDTPPADRPDR
ncbi:MAG: hypothetical protein ACK4I0_01275 [Brevundimonas sp.]|uniref:hypothetical protein n=1 Tax=Brevundimonas sp. TaxID=1871086 RepID=UPI003919D793